MKKMSLQVDVKLRPADRHVKTRFLCVVISWILIVFYFILVEDALGIINVGQTDMFSLLYQATVGFLGGSLVTAIFLGKRSFLVQGIASIAFTLTLVSATSLLGEFKATRVPQNIFQNPVIATEYLLIPFILIFLLDLHSHRLEKISLSHRKYRLLLSSVLAILVATSIISLWIFNGWFR